jgi:sigma-B regulation protein RsbU (phosphoserine phosphatase)
MRILIAEDDFTSRTVLSSVLKKSGHEVIETVNGAAAWNALQQPDAPRLVILDWMMPEMDGLDVLRRVRAQQTDQPPYIIMLTAKGGKADIIAGLDAGADDYLTKPFDAGELRARISVGRRMIEMQTKLEDALQKINESFKAAGRIQLSLLPKPLSAGDRVKFAWKFKPCDAVGGDIFNVMSLDATHIGLYLLDVAGHGLPSAMISVLVYQILNPHTGILVDHTVNPPHILDPEAVLNILDREFPLMRFKRHFTIVYAVLDIVSNTLTYSNAAHCSPIIISCKNDLKILTVSGTVIGVNAFAFGQETVMLSPGDKVVFLSDGVFESGNAANELFGEERLYQTLRELRSATIDDLVQGIYSKVTSFAESQPAADDISILAFEIKD